MPRFYINGERVVNDAPMLLLRGQSNKVRLVVPDLVGKTISLYALDDEGLNPQAQPLFGEWVPLDGDAEWELTQAEAKSGHLKLVVLSRDVLTTLELDCRVMSSNLVDELESVKVSGYDNPSAEHLFFRNESRYVTVTYKRGSPLPGYPLQLKGAVLTGTPTLSVSPTGEHRWSVNASIGSGTFKLELDAGGMRSFPVGTGFKVVSRDLKDEVEAVLVENETYPTNGIVLTRNVSYRITLAYKKDSPLRGHPLTLIATALTGFDPGDLTVSPGSDGWMIRSPNKSGTFKLDLTGEGFNQNMVLPNSKVLSNSLLDQVQLRFNGEVVPSMSTVFFRGRTQCVTLVPKPGSPIAGHPITVTHSVFGSLQPDDVRSVPGFDTPQTNHAWNVTGSNRSGTFNLLIKGEGIRDGFAAIGMKVLSSSLADEADLLISGEVVPVQGVDFIRDSPRVVTLRPKVSSPLSGHPLRLRYVNVAGNSVLEGQPELDVFQEQLSWSVTGKSASGTFRLSVEGKDMQLSLDTPICRLLPAQ